MNILRKGKKMKSFIKIIFLSKYIGLVLGLICVCITIVVWKAAEADSLAKLSQNMESITEIYASKVEEKIDNIDFNLDELAGHGPPNTVKEEDDWDMRTDFYIQNLIGITNIVWVDEDIIVRRVTPKDNSEYIINKKINNEQNNSDFTNLIFPIYNENVIAGFILGNIDVPVLILSVGFEFENDYMIQVFDEYQLLASSDNWKQSEADISSKSDISFNHRIFSFVLTPSKEIVSLSTSNSYFILIFGLFLSVIVSVLALFLQILRKNSKILEQKSTELVEQNIVLEMQKQQLDVTGKRLEVLVADKTIELSTTISVLEIEKDLAQKYLSNLKEAGNIFENSIENAPLPIMIHTEDGTIINLSKTWTKLTQYEKYDIPTIFDWTKKAYNKNKDEMIDIISPLYKLTEIHHDGEFEVTTKDGRKLIWDFNSSCIGNLPDGSAVVMSVAVDVTERIEREREINYISYHDSLTGLYNRRYYEENLNKLDIPENYPLTIAMSDINGLKLINDAFGHSAGDELLISAAKIISDSCRETDLIARIGGDEFIIVMSNTSGKEAEKIIEKINRESKKVTIKSIELSISFGFKTKNKMSEDIQDIYRSAEDLMYRVKLLEIPSMRSGAIETILTTLFEKDSNSEIHSRAVSRISEKIAIAYGMNRQDVAEVKTAGLVHDIGKIIVPISIITKEGKLTTEEYDLIKGHSEIGFRILNSTNDMRNISNIVLSHHERWDGLGYPRGIRTDEIPVQSRIIAVADAFDAMTSERTYREIVTNDQALDEIVNNAGTQFDPKVTKIFEENFNTIIEIN